MIDKSIQNPNWGYTTPPQKKQPEAQIPGLGTPQQVKHQQDYIAKHGVHQFAEHISQPKTVDDPFINGFVNTSNMMGNGLFHTVESAAKYAYEINPMTRIGMGIYHNWDDISQGHYATALEGIGSDYVHSYERLGKDAISTIYHGGLNMIETPQRLYRYAMLNYHEGGWAQLIGSLAPMIGLAVASAMTGGAAGAAGAEGLAAGEAAATAAEAGTAAEGAAAAAEAAGAGEAAAADAGVAGAAEDAAATATRTVAEDKFRSKFESARDAYKRGADRLMATRAGSVARVVGRVVKARPVMYTNKGLAGAQIPYDLGYSAPEQMGRLWNEALDSKALDKVGLPGDIGSFASKTLTGSTETPLKGIVNSIVGFTSTPFMLGRALKPVAPTIRAVDSVAVDAAFHSSRQYRSALGEIIKIADGKYGVPLGEVAGAITRAFPVLEPIAKDLAKVAEEEGSTAYDLSKRIGELADLGNYTDGMKVPTLGLYGAIKTYGKLSGGKLPSYFSRVLAQSPMSVDEIKKAITTNSIRIGEKNAGWKLGQMLQQTGMKSEDITRLVNHLVTTNDVGEWENAIKTAMKENFFQRIDRAMLKSAGLDTEEFRIAFRKGELNDDQMARLNTAMNQRGLRDFYDELRASVNRAVEDHVGSSAAGKSGLFVLDGTGRDVSKVGKEDNISAAVFENQRGELHLPNFHQFDDELHTLIKTYKKAMSGKARFDDMISFGFGKGTGLVDDWFNARFFKPLALLTPGWATRVALSELILNTVRLGPLNMLAGRIHANLAMSEHKASQIAAYNAKKLIGGLQKQADSLRNEIDAMQQSVDEHMITNLDRMNIARDRGKYPQGYDPMSTRVPSMADIEAKQAHLKALEDHIDWLKSPAGTPEPGIVVGRTVGKGSTKAGAWAPDPSAPGMKAVHGEAHDKAGRGPTGPHYPDDTVFGSSPLQAPAREKMISDFLKSKGHSVEPTKIQNLEMIMRGVRAGARHIELIGIGKKDFLQYGAYLLDRHNVLPDAVNAIHKGQYSAIDDGSQYEEVAKTKIRKVNGEKVVKTTRRGELKTKMVLMSPKDFAQVSFGQKGYFEGWFYGANTIMGSQIGRPLAAAYVKLYREGLRGTELRAAATLEAKKIIEGLPEDIRKSMGRDKMARSIHDDPIDSWARTSVDKIEGIAAPSVEAKMTAEEIKAGANTTFVPGKVHEKLLDDIAAGNLPDHVNDFYARYAFDESGKQIDKDLFPRSVITRSPQLHGAVSFFQKLSSAGHTKVLGPIVNYMVRQPTYINEFVLARKALDDAVRRGAITADQADVLAESSAMKNMVKYIHNPDDKTKFEQTISWASPFYFAQNQAWRRAGRLFAENPGAFMQYLYAMTELQGMVNTTKNQNGMSIVVIPSLLLSGVSPTLSTSSLATIDPFFMPADTKQGKVQTLLDLFAPKFGPVTTIAAKEFFALLPHLGLGNFVASPVGQFAERNIEGQIASEETMTQALYQTAFPNSVARNFAALIVGRSQVHATGQNTGLMGMIDNQFVQLQNEILRHKVTEMRKQHWEWLGTKDAENKLNHGKPIDYITKMELYRTWESQHLSTATASGVGSLQSLIDDATGTASWMWLFKSTVGSFAPTTLGFSRADMPIYDQFKKFAAQPKYKNNMMQALDDFEADRPWATAEFVSSSKYTGAHISSTQKSFEWYDTHQGIAQRWPFAAPAIAPDLSEGQTGYQPMNSLATRLGLRSKDTPYSFLEQMDIAAGNSYYYSFIRPVYKALKDGGVKSSVAFKWKQDLLTSYGNYNPLWLNNFQGGIGSTNKQVALNQFMDMTAPQNIGTLGLSQKQISVVKDLRDLHDLMIGQNSNGFLYQIRERVRSGKISSDDARNSWHDTLDAVIKDHPEYKQGIMVLYYNLL